MPHLLPGVFKMKGEGDQIFYLSLAGPASHSPGSSETKDHPEMNKTSLADAAGSGCPQASAGSTV